jgi:putative spermidine/putrescine transport system substrate-binding protein
VTTDDVTKRAVTAEQLRPDRHRVLLARKIVPTGNLKGIDTSASRTPTRSPRCSPPAWWPARRWATRARRRKVIYLEGEKSKAFAKDAVHDDPDLQRRHAGHPPRPDQAPDQLLGRAAEPAVQGQGRDPEHPSIGIMDAAMVVEAMGLHKYRDKGNMTKQEIDLTIKTLIEAKKAGQFRALWKDFNESVNLMASGEVVIQSMWSPGGDGRARQGHRLRVPAAQGRLPRLGGGLWPAGHAVGQALTRPTSSSTGSSTAGPVPT